VTGYDPTQIFRATEQALGQRFRLERIVAVNIERVLFAGRDTILNRPVSIRVNFYSSESLRTWFLLEAEALARLDHPAVRHVYDVGVVGDIAYRIGNWIEGEGLHEAVARGPRPIPECTISPIPPQRLEHARPGNRGAPTVAGRPHLRGREP
jgi:serine/threonine-protein kinase